MRKSNGLWALIVLTIIGCGKQETNKTSEPVKIQTMQVISKDIPVQIDSFGTLSAYRNVDIKAQVSGQVKKVYFEEGNPVKKGELLISIDDEQYKATLRIDEATLLQDAEDYNYQKRVLEKDKKLYLSGCIPKQTYEKMLSDFVRVEAKLKSDQAKIDIDKINLKHCSITSPVDGVIGYLKVDEGNIITVSGDTLVNVKEIDSLYVDFNVPEKDLFRIKNALQEKGKIKIVINVNSRQNDNSDCNLQYDGTLKFLNNEIQDASGTIHLKGIIPNPKMDLLPGLFVNVKLIVGELKNATLIPEEGLILDNDKHYFFTVSNNGLTHKALVDVIGTYENCCVAVKSENIRPGDKVIVTGLLNLDSNERVSIDNDSKVIPPERTMGKGAI